MVFHVVDKNNIDSSEEKKNVKTNKKENKWNF